MSDDMRVPASLPVVDADQLRLMDLPPIQNVVIDDVEYMYVLVRPHYRRV